MINTKTKKGAPETVSPDFLGDYELPQSKRQGHLKGRGAGHLAEHFSLQDISALARFAQILANATPSSIPAEGSDPITRTGSLTKQDASLFINALLDRIYHRVPAPTQKKQSGQHCPFTGLNRGQFYELFKLRQNGKSVIRSVSLREDGETRGARFYNVGDSLRYMDRRAEEQGRSEPAKT
jgi:hypothetical protein